MKKYILKTLVVSALGLLVLLQTGCSDLLDQEPQGSWVKGDNTDGSYQTEIFALYAKMRAFGVTSGNGPMAIHSFRSEDAEKGSSAGDGAPHAAMYDDFEYNASNGLIGGYWKENYEMVHAANRVLDEIAQVATLSDGDKINQGEAHFFRAFAYFNLVRAFGEIPKIDFKIDNAIEANVAKSSVNDIYALIDADLTEAATNLPKIWDQKFIGRLTWGAARGLHAKAYMTRNDWAKMNAAAMEVIGSGLYDLSTPFDKIFRETGENGKESILEVQCTATAALPGSGTIGSEFAAVQGVRGANQWNLGWGWNTPTLLLANAFEAGDPRRDETLLYFVKTGEDPSLIPANKPWGEKPVAAADVINKYYNKKAYTNPDLRALYSKSGFWFNIRLLRYSDIVLMAAESANELGKTADAVTYLEMVRARARGNDATVLPKVTTADQTVLRDAIRHERRVELGMEYDRFYDLVRWGTARQVLHAAGKTKYEDKHKYLPLPQAEVDKSNGVLVQNPNY